jgi:hypothetical protein
VALEWASSADRHQVEHEDAVHAMSNAVYVEQEFDEPRGPAEVRPTLFIGPPRRRGAPLLEVMVEMIPPRTVVVFHVMEARPKHLKRMEESR